MADHVRLLGAVARPDVPALLRSADVVACVPWYEPFGIVPLEAMACGVPVVGSAVGGLLDTRRRTDRPACWCRRATPTRSPPPIGRLLDNPSLRVHMGDEAAARVRQQFTWDLVAALDARGLRAPAGARPRPRRPTAPWAVTA